MATTLLSLPNELLEQILEESRVPLPTLYALAFLCSRLHEICLSAYIKRSGLPKVNERCTVVMPYQPVNHDLMTALCLSSSVKQTQHFHCKFPRFATDQSMLRHFQRVERFVAKLKSVDEVILSFKSSEEVTPIFTEDEAIAWFDGLGNLLNTIVQRGCSSLEINGLLKIMDVYREVPVMSPESHSQSPSLFVRIKNLFNDSLEPASTPVLAGSTWRYERNPPASGLPTRHILTELSPNAQANSSLTHLTIRTKSFLCPPVLQWTYSILSASPITDLTIEDVDFSCRTWSILIELLPQAALTLKGFRLKKCRGLSDHQVTQFIKGFPDLERLSLEQLSSLWGDSLNPFSLKTYSSSGVKLLPDLPRLTSLRAEAKWVLAGFMRSSSKEPFFPALQDLTVVFSSHGSHSWSIAGLSSVQYLNDRNLLAELAKNGQNLTFSVNLEFLVPEDIVWWMQQMVDQGGSSGETAGWMNYVSGIVLVVDRRVEWSHRRNVKETVRLWYQQFPRLKKLVMNARNDEPFVERSVDQFCQSKLSKVVKGLEHFEVNGRFWEPSY